MHRIVSALLVRYQSYPTGNINSIHPAPLQKKCCGFGGGLFCFFGVCWFGLFFKQGTPAAKEILFSF